jgi:hypothetical protein
MSGGNQKSSTSDTALSNEQAAILRQREQQYQKFFFPELMREMNDANNPAGNSMFAQQAVQSTNQAFQGANQQFQQQAAQRGLAGSGVEIQGLASLNSARARSIGDAMAQAEMARQQKKGQLLQMGGSLSPQPTTAAPLNQQSSGTQRFLGII